MAILFPQEPTPSVPTGKVGLFLDSSGELSKVDSLGVSASIGGGSLLSTKVNITSTQLKNLITPGPGYHATSTVELVPAPGPGKIIEVVSAFAYMETYGGIQYAGTLGLALIQTEHEWWYWIMDNERSILATTESGVIYPFLNDDGSFLQGISNGLDPLNYRVVDVNYPVKLIPSGAGSNPTTGNSDISVYVSYRIVTL